MHTSIHPAPGIGELVPGFFSIPQNPLRLANHGVKYTPRLGELLPATFTIPENPLLAKIGKCNCQCGVAGCGCNCAGVSSCGVGGCWHEGLSGLGAFDPSSFFAGLSTPVLVGGALLLLLLVAGPGARQRRKMLSEEEKRHKQRVGEIKKKYKRLPRTFYAEAD